MKKFFSGVLAFLSPKKNPLALFIYATVLVFSTYNIWGHSVWHWLQVNAGNFMEIWPEYTLVVLLLLGAWAIFFRAAHSSMKWYGLLTVFLIVGLAAYTLFEHGWLDSRNQNTVILTGQIALALAIGFASSFSRIWYALFRQRSVDTVEGDTIGVEDDDQE